MPFQLQSARFCADIEGANGKGSVEISIYRSGRGRYEVDCYVSGVNGEPRYGGQDSSLNRNFEDWKEALNTAAKAAVFKVNNGQLRFIGPWVQESARHVEVDKDGKEVKIQKSDGCCGTYPCSNYKEDIELEIILPQSEGDKIASKIELPVGAAKGLASFKKTRFEDGSPK